MESHATENLKKERIHAVSFDAHYCIFHEGVKKKSSPNTFVDVIRPNKALFDKIKKENQRYTKAICLNGSSGQSYDTDRQYALDLRTDSFFLKICEINHELGTELDGFLLADIHHNLPNGTSFENALQKRLNPLDPWIDYRTRSYLEFDETKFSIIYAQAHKLASDYPDAKIHYDFYHNNSDSFKTLEQITKLFTKYPQLLPKNVTFRLMPYSNGIIPEQAYFKCKGRGKIDYNYAQNIRDLAADHKQKGYWGLGGLDRYSFALYMNRDDLIAQTFIARVSATHLTKPFSPKGEFYYTDVLSTPKKRPLAAVQKKGSLTQSFASTLVFFRELSRSVTCHAHFKLRCLQALFLASAALSILAILIAAKAFSMAAPLGMIILITAIALGGVGLLASGYGLQQQKQQAVSGLSN